MKKAYLVKLADATGDLIVKLVDQETWDWINLDNPGKPELLKKGDNCWIDQLCPENIKERIIETHKYYGDEITEIEVTGGSWRNDRAILAPPLENKYDDYELYYASTKSILSAIEYAKKEGYDVELEEEYNGVMY